MSGKLTKAQFRVLTSVANRGAAYTAYALGRGTCEALRVRGLISTWDRNDIPIDRSWNPYIYITPAGRSALSAQGREGE